MAKALHVTDYLWNPAKFVPKVICVLFGSESYLKHFAFQHVRDQTLDNEDAEFSLTRFDGASAQWSQVQKDVSTVAMFGGGKRLVVVEDADSFITKNRDQIEKYLAAPSRENVLLLMPNTFVPTTNLYKKAIDIGLLIDCSPLPEKDIAGWIVRWGKQRHHVVIDVSAAQMLVSLIGAEPGLLDQEIAKLALMVSNGETIGSDLVEKAVGSWRTRTTFEMLDLALSGKTAEAIRQLDNLFLAGENPVGILAQISATLRKLASATGIIVDAEKQGRKIGVAPALERVGVNRYFLAKTESQLKMLGRYRGVKLNDWLLQADLDLKGASRLDPRLILETLIYRISDPRLKII